MLINLNMFLRAIREIDFPDNPQPGQLFSIPVDDYKDRLDHYLLCMRDFSPACDPKDTYCYKVTFVAVEYAAPDRGRWIEWEFDVAVEYAAPDRGRWIEWEFEVMP